MKREYLDLLKALVSMAPVSSDIAAVNRASACVEEFLKSRGIRVVREECSGRNALYASTLPEGKTTRFLFNAHLDVVPLSSPDQSTAVERDGLLYGRGVGDCLGHAVAMIQLLCENPGASLAAIFTMDEEIGGSTTAEVLRRGYTATEGVIVLDAWSDGDIVSCEKGMMNVRLTAHGKAGHAAYPWRADNALERLMEACCRLRAAWKNPTDENDAWHDTFTATQIQCDSTAKNVIPGNASLILNIRYTQPDTEDSILARIREITGLDDVEPLMSDYALPVIGDETCPFLQKVLSVSSEVRGRRLAFAKMNGATDSRHVVQLCPGIPVLVSGCRHGAIHALGEWLDLADYDRMIEIFNRIVRESN